MNLRRWCRSEYRCDLMAPVHAEDNGFRVRVLRSNIANPCKSRAFLAPSGRGTKITCEHLRLVARLECCPLKVVHGDIGTCAEKHRYRSLKLRRSELSAQRQVNLLVILPPNAHAVISTVPRNGGPVILRDRVH